MAKQIFDQGEVDAPTDLLTKRGKVKSAGLRSSKKPALAKFGSSKSNGLPRKQKM